MIAQAILLRVTAAALLGSLIANGLLTIAWDRAASARDAAQIQRDNEHASAQGNRDAANLLQARLLDCAALLQDAAAAKHDAESARTQLQAKLDAAARAERDLRDKLYANDPDCAAMARMRVCPAVEQRLRADAARDHSHR